MILKLFIFCIFLLVMSVFIKWFIKTWKRVDNEEFNDVMSDINNINSKYDSVKSENVNDLLSKKAKIAKIKKV